MPYVPYWAAGECVYTYSLYSDCANTLSLRQAADHHWKIKLTEQLRATKLDELNACECTSSLKACPRVAECSCLTRLAQGDYRNVLWENAAAPT